MAKVTKTFFIMIISLLLISNISPVFAALDMDLNTTNATNNTSNTSTTNTSTTNTSSSTSSVATTSTLSSTVTTSAFDLELTNILSICLIVVGVLLILLGIAILIRLKQ